MNSQTMCIYIALSPDAIISVEFVSDDFERALTKHGLCANVIIIIVIICYPIMMQL